MSEAVHIEGGKINKSEAIRQAMEALGGDASSKDLCAYAAKLAGTEIDIRAVYQMKSNMKSDSKPAKKTEKKAVKKVAKPTTIKQPSKKAIEFLPNFVQVITSLKEIIHKAGGKEQFLLLVDAIA